MIAATAGLVLAALAYAGRAVGRRAPLAVGAAVARLFAVLLLVALLLDAPLGRARPPAPFAALDVSTSWARGGDGARFAAARDSFTGLPAATAFLFGDSLRAGPAPAAPTDLASGVRGAVDRALAAGRALIVITDGELDDAAALDRLPAGSSVRVLARAPGADAAPVAIDAPRAAVGGDTADVRVRIAAGGAATAAGIVRVTLDDAVVGSAALDAIAPFAEQSVALRVRLPAREGAAVLRAIAAVPGDTEPRNDTLTTTLELSAAAGVTVVSTAPDFDVRYMLDVLRGTVALPTRAYVQVAPGQWRQEGSLAPVAVETVRLAVRRAPIVVLHGDTSAFGAPAAATTGAVLLMPAPAAGTAEWYGVAAPPSPIAGALTGAPWDSLAPLALTGAAPQGSWTGLTVQRGRRFEQQAAVAGTEEPRRRIVVGVGGLWRWRFRGGAAADAFGALWGGMFDWLAAERRDARAAVPDARLVRAGEPVRWRRGGADSLAHVVLRRRGGTDSLALSLTFSAGAATTTSPPLAPGVYDLRLPAGSAVLAVNASRELLPRRPTIAAGPVGAGPAPAGLAPRLRQELWPYILIVLLLCAEWLARRRVGMR